MKTFPLPFPHHICVAWQVRLGGCKHCKTHWVPSALSLSIALTPNVSSMHSAWTTEFAIVPVAKTRRDISVEIQGFWTVQTVFGRVFLQRQPCFLCQWQRDQNEKIEIWLRRYFWRNRVKLLSLSLLSSANWCAWKLSFSLTHFDPLWRFCLCSRGTSQAKMPYLQLIVKQSFS